jgi:hypothetical protein
MGTIASIVLDRAAGPLANMLPGGHPATGRTSRRMARR